MLSSTCKTGGRYRTAVAGTNDDDIVMGFQILKRNGEACHEGTCTVASSRARQCCGMKLAADKTKRLLVLWGATHVKQAFFIIPEIVIVMKTIPALLDESIIFY
jgi:hypothetical protein